MADTIRESNMFGFQILTKTCKQRHGNHTKSDSSGGWFQPMPNIFFLVFSFPRRVGKYVKKWQYMANNQPIIHWSQT